MKKLFASLALIASMVLAPLAPAVQALVTGTFTTNIVVPNVSSHTVVFPALSGGAAASATTTITIAALSGGVNGTAAASATGTIDVTGSSGTTTSITVGGTSLLSASSSVAFNTDATVTASDIAAAINVNTNVSGFSATSIGSTVTVTAPASAGASINGTAIVVSSDYLSAGASFSGGASGTAGANASTTSSTFAAVTSNNSADLTLNIGSTTVSLTNGMTGAQVAAAVVAAINANAGSPYTASLSGTDKVVLTAKASGTAGNSAVVAADLDYNAASVSNATAISDHFIAAGTSSSTDLSLNIGSTTISLTGGNTGAQVAAAVAAAINANASAPYTASVTNTDEVMLTSKTSGTAGNGATVASDLSYNAAAQVVTFTPANVTLGETFRATVNGTNYDMLATGSSTVASVTAALAPMIDANAAVSCTADSSKITCTSSVAGTPFTASATVLAATSSSTVNPIAIISSNANAACAKAGDTVTLNFTTSETLATSSSSVLIGGSTTTIVSLGGNVYSASRVLNGSTTPGFVTFSLNAQDVHGNTSMATTTTNNSSVTFDNTAPIISLNGDANMNLNFGLAFNDPGASSTDSLQGTVTPTVTGSVDVLNPGTYTITYTAMDCAGNTASTTRTVTVGAAPIPGGHRSSSGSSVPPSTSNGIGFIASAVAELLAPVTTGPATPTFIQQVLGATTFRFTFNLKKGMSGEAVLELQRKLAELGFYSGPQTGFFGQLTFNGVVKFQKARRISGTGLVGPLTRAQLNAE